ncbi:hypothetical protein HYPSUDRAFT_394544 [Hypholoma sublateritium FD-334 SS-4]|uniref:Uncharacterized protein n=1 Tax=Hypholoma sublateritium (strain FD-334 SS-4) TaxID=945553 RepID=A0A0D2N826_HYPSF|nr:hypothetical protein HYPSUDRAFT_394544 [Hypholoma sublateritium FD-334 SS-4]
MVHSLGNLPALSYIRVESHSGVLFVDALLMDYDDMDRVDAENLPLYFRSLVSISLSVSFEAKNPDAQNDAEDIILAMLQDCLIQRYECGAEIQKLSLYNCYCLDACRVRELEYIVVDVNWDGIEQGFECEEEEEGSEGYDLQATALGKPAQSTCTYIANT